MAMEEGKKEKVLSESERFEKQIYEEIRDESFRKLVKPFLISPSSIQKINLDEQLKKAKEAEEKKNFVNELHHLRIAAIAGFYQRSEDNSKVWETYRKFLKEHKDLPVMKYGYPDDVRAYDRIRKEELMGFFIGTYGNMLGITPKVEKKEQEK